VVNRIPKDVDRLRVVFDDESLVSDAGLLTVGTLTKRLGQKSLVLANGSRDIFDTYGMTALWDGHPRFVDADEADATPLPGMSMLDSHNLNIDVEDGGRVVIQAKT